ELLTGTTPLERDRVAEAALIETLQRIRNEEAAPPSVRLRRSRASAEIATKRPKDQTQFPKQLDRELDWITMKALEKDRARRYETANGMARDLERCLAGEPVEAAPPSASYRISKFARKHRLALATAAAFTAMLVTAVVVSSWMAVRARRAEQEAQAVNDFLRYDLLAQAGARSQASPNAKPDPHLEVRTALDRAAARIVGKFATQPLVEAAIQQTISQTYSDLGLYPEAQHHAERALELRRRMLGEKNPETLRTMFTLATL